MPINVALDIPVDDRFVALARFLAAEAGRMWALGDERVYDVKVAVSEIVTNAVRAHRDAGLADPVRITVELDGEFVITVFDRGRGFPPDARPAIDERGVSGHGLLIAQALTDDLHISRRDDGGMAVAMAWR